ncbi:ATP-grasp domain-containing protein [Clostridium sp. JS66]|uniref:ATP-grasp domain-containing protein n=1 Tax=Clostridium sp. JS66 TaxID=3064705 RepID=UPI00298DC7CB|nr:ATP-grasp domain-containing protein [Clostridium sp. JS66]WPC43408.1 ATP-grasp domain-containing protein [Clostridium sp. JS66]
MKIYIKKNSKGEIASHNIYLAYEGFMDMGFEIIFYENIDEVTDNRKEDLIVGTIEDTRKTLSKFKIEVPEICYPDELKAFLGRKVWKSKLSNIENDPSKWNIFIKPIEGKRFTGLVVKEFRDFIGLRNGENDIDILCSETVNFVSEWRCFVRYGKILDVRRYRGDWRNYLNPKIVDKAISEFISAPYGYGIDFGVTDKGETLLIEVNEGYSLGSYGLQSIDYAKLLSARWAELTNSVDECDF